MALFSKRNIKCNPFGLTEDDLKENLEGFPIGVVVRMMEEQATQKCRPNVEVFQREPCSGTGAGGFSWDLSQDGLDFWSSVIVKHNFNLFFEKYPEYARYNLA